MTHLLRGTALGGALLAALPASAQFAGGQVDLTFRNFNDSDISATTGRASGELAVTKEFSLQGDIFMGKVENGSADDLSGPGATLHGLFHVSPTSSVGAFVTHERLEGDGLTSFGVEAGAMMGGFASEVWLGVGEDQDGSDANYFGLETRHAAGIVNLTGSLEYYNISGDLSSVQGAIGVEYAASNGFAVAAQLENNYFEYDDVASESDTSVSVNATYRFGKRPGTVFGERSLLGIFR